MDKIISKSKERFFFTKTEKLRSKKLIDLLFKEGKAIKKKSVKCLYLIPTEKIDSPLQVMISVPKRLFKRATDRNLIKRRIREAYRLNKNSLVQFCREENRQLILAILYQNTAIAEYKTLEIEIKKIIAELADKVA